MFRYHVVKNTVFTLCVIYGFGEKVVFCILKLQIQEYLPFCTLSNLFRLQAAQNH